MGLKYYLNLFKKDSNNEAIKLRYFLNTFCFIVYFVLFAAYSSLRDTNVIASSVFGILTIATLILYRLLNKSFSRLIKRLIADEQLRQEDETDAAFIAYRKGYAQYNEKSRKTERKLLPLNIVWFALVVAFLPVPAVLNLAGKTDWANTVSWISGISMNICFFAIIVISLFLSRQGVWYQNYAAELNVINKYKSASLGANIKFKILEDKKQDRQMDYILPDPDLRKRYKKLDKISKILGFFLGALFVVSIMMGAALLGKFFDEDTVGQIMGFVLLGNIALLVVFGLVMDKRQKSLFKRQYLLLKEDENANSLYLTLHELRTPFMNRWNILFIVCFAGNIVSNILFAGIVSVIFKTDAYGWIFSLLFLVEFVATFVFYFRAYGKIRLRMMPIEDEIDRTTAVAANKNGY